MPHRTDRPSESKIQWLSEAEKEAALRLVPAGESFSNFARRKLFNLPPLTHGGSRKDERMKLEGEIANLRSQAATNDAYAEAAERTAAETGRASALNQAAQHRAAAERKRAQADKLKQQLQEQK